MTVAETVLQKLQQLPEQRQREVLALVEKIESECKATAPPWRDPYGSCADLRTDLSFEEFQKNRQEMWGTASDKELR